jgi:hypothetical protein
MSIFVDRSTTIPINIRYVPRKNERGKVISVKILKDGDPTVDGEELLQCESRSRDFETMSDVLEASTIINHISAKPMIRTKVFRTMIINRFFTSWNVTDENGPIAINEQSVGNLYYDLVRELVNQWLNLTRSK